MIATISVTPSRNLRASTPLLIDGHADGNADINRRVVIRAYAPCLAWKTIFYTGDNSCRPVRPLHLTPSFLLSSSSSISLSLSLSLAFSLLLAYSFALAIVFLSLPDVLLFHVRFSALASLSPQTETSSSLFHRCRDKSMYI